MIMLDDFGATLDDTPEEGDANGDESDHTICDWEVNSRTTAASDNEDGERSITPEDGERTTAPDDGE
ncbi:hypothetical protein PsorP6_015546 [Peronosclerospora sorghi]|uniref:Uncharacterized protein n=1 Tax=Peronosclerospora sorghi TaxID=230839 RepID=A0ACC0WMG4_9STRA|nr:hypothetical protein PsorP6_015546 [Peronosclerospora sorghi]